MPPRIIAVPRLSQPGRLLALTLALWAAPACAVELENLRALVTAGKEQFRSLPTDHAVVARAKLVETINQFRRSLRNPAVAQSWSDYLQLDDLPTVLDGPADRQLAALDKLYFRLTADEPGIELPAMLRLRSAAKTYQATLQLEQVDVSAEFQRRLTMLDDDLRQYGESHDVRAADRIGHTVRWLEEAGQTPELVAAIRRRWSQPNLLVQVSHDFVGPLAAKDVAEESIETVNILGTWVHGPAITTGKLVLEFIENPKNAETRIRMSGETQSPSSIGYKGPATIFSSSVTSIDAVKQFTFDPDRGLIVQSTRACCRTQAHVHDIQICLKRFDRLLNPLVTKIAWKKSRKLHSAAELEAARIAARKIEKSLEKQAREPVGQWTDKIQQVLFTGPLRLDEQGLLSSSTTPQVLQVRLSQARPHQLAADDSPRGIKPDLIAGLSVHESFFNNMTSRLLLQGPEHADEHFEKLANFLVGEVTPELRVFSNSVPWSATLHHDKPATVSFRGGQMDLTVHADAWTIDRRRFERPFDVRAVYRLDKARFGVRFTRIGDVPIAPRDGRPWTVDEQRDLLPHLERKVRAMLPPEGSFNNLVLPQGGTFGVLGRLQLTQLVCDGGWLVLGYRDKPAP